VSRVSLLRLSYGDGAGPEKGGALQTAYAKLMQAELEWACQTRNKNIICGKSKLHLPRSVACICLGKGLPPANFATKNLPHPKWTKSQKNSICTENRDYVQVPGTNASSYVHKSSFLSGLQFLHELGALFKRVPRNATNSPILHVPSLVRKRRTAKKNELPPTSYMPAGPALFRKNHHFGEGGQNRGPKKTTSGT